ncbi:MobC family plasmid mobilization relaxosome protein [Algoriphagus aquimarinus]|uniref:MobC family plasmid mobilization relaxosome protein n=1 Tax=Algoriphagus aquimarinus TaxID=237018 RepID=UPI0030DC48E1
MARPKLPQKEKRDIKFTFKMNELELQALAELTEYSNLSPTEVIRSCVFKNRLLKAKIPVVDMNTYLELKKIGTNINQIAKQYNSGKEVPADKLRVFISLKVKLDSILNKLIDDR